MRTIFLRRHSPWQTWVLALPVALAGWGALPASAQDKANTTSNALAIKTLTEQARFWESKGRSDLAAAAWRRLLQIDPRNPDALAGLARYELDRNQPEAAREIVEQLKRQPQTNQEAIRRIEGAVTQQTLNTKQLEQARQAARAGRLDEAVALYRQLLEGRPLVGPIALEFYQTLGGTSTGWEEARKGLARLAAEEPSNHAVALAYAQHLTYRAATRREGIRMLAELARKPSVGAAATDAWRKALIWLEASRADAPLFQAYLGVQPNDSAIRARLASLTQEVAPRPIDPRALALREAYDALNMGDVGQAEKRFENLLATSPRNPDALGGLGVVRLRQERFAEAQKLLEEAARLGGNRKWDEALRSARFWLALEQGDQAVAQGDLSLARRLYQRAAEIDPKAERPAAALADLLVQEGRLNDAEQAYRALRQQYPQSVDILRGFAGVLVRQGKVDEALALAEGLSEVDKDALGYGGLKAEQYRTRAKAELAAGQTLAAMQALEEALLWDPNSPWLRLELARLYHRSGATAEAFGLMDGLLQSHPDMPDALYAAALMSAEAKEYTLALTLLEKIPPSARTRDMTELQHRMWVRAKVAQAEVLAQTGQGAAAQSALEQAQQAAGRDADLLAAIAQATASLGDETRALTLMRSLLAQTPKPSAGLLVQYAGLLLRTRQDVELAAQLRQLYTLTLSPEQRKDVDAIRWAYSIRQADAQREAGNHAAAYDIVAQLLSEQPNDLAAQQALARLYSSAGEPARALAWYHQIIQMMGEPDVSTLVAAGGAALAAGELRYAESALEAAARLAPAHPDVLIAQGRLARALGQNRRAVTLLEQAQRVTDMQRQAAGLSPLGVNMVDYTLPAAPVRGGTAPAGQPIPPIPNPVAHPSVAARLPTAAQPAAAPLQPVPPATLTAPQMRPVLQPAPAWSAGAPQPAAAPTPTWMPPPQPLAPPMGAPMAAPMTAPMAAPAPVAPAPAANPPAAAPALRPGAAAQPAAAVPLASAVDASRGAPDRLLSTRPAPADAAAMRPVQYNPAAVWDRSAPSAPQPMAVQPWQVPQPQSVPVLPSAAPVLQPVGPTAAPAFGAPAAAEAWTPPRTPPSPYQQPLLMPPSWSTASPSTAPAVAAEAPRASSAWDFPAPGAAARPRPSGTGALQREIEELRADRAGSLAVGGQWRGRSGDAGMSELTDFSTAIEGRFPYGQGSHLVLRLEPVFISAGRVDLADKNIAQQFGANALALIGSGIGTVREQQDSGMALSVGLETARLKLDLGTTPLGFEVTNLVGGLAYSDALGDLKLKLDLSRRPVTDSVLSYAGTRDDVTGRTWGGVTATGARMELSVEQGDFGIFGYGGLHALRGKGVVNNSRFEVGGGAYYKLIREPDMELTAGVSLTALGYKRNLRYFTLGHGGYFSPQRYFSLALPLELTGRYGRVAYKIDGSVGIQTFRENSAAYFPADATLQSNWETAAAANAVAAPTGVSYRAFYPSQSKSGLGFRLGGEAEYQFTPQWSVGGKVAIDNASDYTQTSGMVFLKYSFDPVYVPVRVPPRMLKVGQ